MSSGVNRPNIIVAIAACILGFVIGTSFRNLGDTNTAKSTLQSNIEAVAVEDRAAMLASFHTKSPFVDDAAALYDQLMPLLDVHAKLLSFEPMGASGDLLVARYTQLTMAEGTDAKNVFVNNEIDGIAIFCHEQGAPRLWMTVPIVVREAVVVEPAK